MSLTSKLALAGSIIFTAGMISYVHLQQATDKENMREGVYRDIQRQEKRKIQNLKMLQDQQELTKILKKQRDEEERSRLQKEET